jgi:hypothetical protein
MTNKFYRLWLLWYKNDQAYQGILEGEIELVNEEDGPLEHHEAIALARKIIDKDQYKEFPGDWSHYSRQLGFKNELGEIEWERPIVERSYLL